MRWSAREGWSLLVLVAAIPVAAAATVTVIDGTLAAGQATVPRCDTAVPAVVQNIGTGGDAASVVSVNVSGIDAACGGGLLKVSVFNGSDTVREATKVIPAGGGTVNVVLDTPVPLKQSHFLSVALEGPV